MYNKHMYVIYKYKIYVSNYMYQNHVPSLKELAHVNQLSLCTMDSDGFFKWQPEN